MICTSCFVPADDMQFCYSLYLSFQELFHKLFNSLVTYLRLSAIGLLTLRIEHFFFFFLKLHWPKASELLSWRCVCHGSVHPSVHALVNSSFKKLLKLLTGFFTKFHRNILRWSPFKFLQIIVFNEEFLLPLQSQ